MLHGWSRLKNLDLFFCLQTSRNKKPTGRRILPCPVGFCLQLPYLGIFRIYSVAVCESKTNSAMPFGCFQNPCVTYFISAASGQVSSSSIPLVSASSASGIGDQPFSCAQYTNRAASCPFSL